MELGDLTPGLGFCFEFCIEVITENFSKPTLDSVTITFERDK